MCLWPVCTRWSVKPYFVKLKRITLIALFHLSVPGSDSRELGCTASYHRKQGEERMGECNAAITICATNFNLNKETDVCCGHEFYW